MKERERENEGKRDGKKERNTGGRKHIEKKLRIRASAALVQEHDCIALAEPIVLLYYCSFISHYSAIQ